MEIIKSTLLSNWSLMRWIRLGFGIFMTVQAIQFHDLFAGAIAFLFLFQAVTNTGCCGSSGCAVPVTDSQKGMNEPVEFEEVITSKEQKNN